MLVFQILTFAYFYLQDFDFPGFWLARLWLPGFWLPRFWLLKTVIINLLCTGGRRRNPSFPSLELFLNAVWLLNTIGSNLKCDGRWRRENPSLPSSELFINADKGDVCLRHPPPSPARARWVSKSQCWLVKQQLPAGCRGEIGEEPGMFVSPQQTDNFYPLLLGCSWLGVVRWKNTIIEYLTENNTNIKCCNIKIGYKNRRTMNA